MPLYLSTKNSKIGLMKGSFLLGVYFWNSVTSSRYGNISHVSHLRGFDIRIGPLRIRIFMAQAAPPHPNGPV